MVDIQVAVMREALGLDMDPAALADLEVADSDPEDTPVVTRAVDTQLDPEVVSEEVTEAGSEVVMEVDLEEATEVASDQTAVSVGVPAITD